MGTLIPDPSRPDSFANDQVSIYIEDEIALADNLWLTIGTRQYYGELTDHDWAAKAALVWEAKPLHFFSASIARAFARPVMQQFFAYESPNFDPADDLGNESMMSYELGYRGQLTDKFVLNMELFYNQNKDLIGLNSTVTPFLLGNVLDVDTYGIETSIDYRPYEWWYIRATHSYAYQPEQNDLNENTNALRVFTIPKHTGTLMNRFYLGNSTTLNTQLFYSDSYFDNRRVKSRTEIESFLRFDARLGQRFWNDAAEIAIGITNVDGAYHYEGGPEEVPRLYYLQFFYNF